MQLTVLGAALALLVVWLFLRRRRDRARVQAEETPEGREKSPYHAVSIRYDANACEAAKAMSGRRFLSSAAPRLPLPECDAPECRCRFMHHEDRRSGKDRRSPFAAAGYGGGTGSFEKERRERSERRKSDNQDDDFSL